MTALLSWLCCAALAGDVYEQPAFGLRLETPSGWTRREIESTDRALHVVFDRTDRDVRAQLSIHARVTAGSADPKASRDAAVQAAKAKSDWSKVDAFEGRIALRRAPGLRAEVHSGGEDYRFEQLYVHEHEISYVLQTAVHVSDWSKARTGIESVWASFELIAPSDEAAAKRRLRELAARCGSEIEWAANWKDAAERARRAKKLVLVSARVYPGFQMSDELMAGPYMDPDIVALVNERYVAVRYPCGPDAPFISDKVYGMGPHTFGVAALLVTPDGRVVRETWAPNYEFFASGVEAHSDWRGSAPARAADTADQARIHLIRGEHAQARKLLGRASKAREFAVLADLHRREQSGAEALEAIALARAAPGADEVASELDLLEAEVWMRVGDYARAEPALARLSAGASAQAPQALYFLGALRHATAGRAAAEESWRPLFESHADNRWAWKAAATSTGTAWELDRSGRVTWLNADEREVLRRFEYEPRPPSKASVIQSEAVTWLVERQQADGSWLMARSLSRSPAEVPDDFKLAITALCGLSLAPHGASSASAARALQWLRTGYERARESGGEALFMDYSVWSRACMLLFTSECRRRATLDEAEFKRIGAALVGELASKQRRGGGWSYYLTRDLASSSTDQQSISFVTAAVALALMRARDAGLELPPGLLDRALDQLERMRNANETFEYMLGPDAPLTARATTAPGAAGRSPLCMLALHLGGRVGAPDLRAALDLFVEHRGGLSSEIGKSLLHTGLEGQGSHYVLFDFAMAAIAIAALPPGQRSRYRSALLDEVMRARTIDGSFVDSPTLGAACGTALALIAMEHLHRP